MNIAIHAMILIKGLFLENVRGPRVWATVTRKENKLATENLLIPQIVVLGMDPRKKIWLKNTGANTSKY